MLTRDEASALSGDSGFDYPRVGGSRSSFSRAAKYSGGLRRSAKRVRSGEGCSVNGIWSEYPNSGVDSWNHGRDKAGLKRDLGKVGVGKGRGAKGGGGATTAHTTMPRTRAIFMVILKRRLPLVNVQRA